MNKNLEAQFVEKYTSNLNGWKEQMKRCEEWRTSVTYCAIYNTQECPMKCNYALRGGK